MNFQNNLPPGCSSSEIERRFGDGDPDVDANDSGERCEACCELLEECKCPKHSEDEP